MNNNNAWSENFEIYLKVPYDKRSYAKDQKMWWNHDKKQWFKRFKACDYDLSEYDQSEFMEKLLNSLGELIQFNFIECKFNTDFKFEKEFNVIMRKIYKKKRDNWMIQNLTDDHTSEN